MSTTETNEIPIEGITPGITGRVYSGEGWTEKTLSVPSEMALTIYVNTQELVTILCTPARLNPMVAGFLYSEQIIESMKDIASMRVCEDDSLADVKLLNKDFKAPSKRTLTSGCGGGTSFGHRPPPVVSEFKIKAAQVLDLMKQMLARQEIFQQSGGIHCSALCDNEKIIAVAEDIGRHNTIDKIIGECLLRKIPFSGGMIVTTGRISSEMVLKAARMKTPVVASRSGATDRAVKLGNELGVTVVSYARAGRLSVLTHPERIE